MAFEWEMVSEPMVNIEEVAQWLRRDFEPFAVAPDEEGNMSVWLKRHSFTESDEPRSSVHEANRIEQEQPDGD